MSNRSLKIDSALAKISLTFGLLLSLVFVVIAVKSLLGNAISAQVDTKDVAEIAVALAPNDPKTHFSLASINERSFLPEDGPRSLAGFEKATSLSPYDYRLWLALGKSRERAGDVDGAEKDLKRALELAPNYAQVKWTYGNILLRKGNTAEAFKMIRNAVDNDPRFANPAATTAWQIFDGDIEKIKQTIGESPKVKASLALFLAKQEKFDDAYDIWNSLPKAQLKTEFKENSEVILRYLLNGRKYKKAISIKSQISGKDTAAGKFEQVTNGGFESNVRTDKPELFDWEIARGVKPQISLAGDQKHGGAQSLLINFNITNRDDFRTISQTIAVESGKAYVLEFYYRSDVDVKETVRWEVLNAIGQTVLAASDAVRPKSDWEKQEIEFTTPESSEGIILRMVRDGCESIVCPITGRMWFDDFRLK
ncbi:MAG: tetratricopeptide repeat protein [Acidobacteria bacterium]|nr:tetratricopeptide repeat protein [Acidobacteriota bacterium]